MKFLHSMIRVYDVQKSIDFYTKLFGLKLSRQADLEDCTLYYLKDEITGVEIELTANFEKPEDKYVKGEAFGHFAFEVENISEFSNKLKSLGYEYIYEPFEIVLETKDGLDKLKVAFLHDPDGNEIEVIEKK